MLDPIPELEPGQLPDLADYNELVRRANRQISSEEYSEDELATVMMERQTPFPFDLYEITDNAWNQFSESHKFEFSIRARPVILAWVFVDDDGKFTGPANRGDEGAVRRYRRNDNADEEFLFLFAWLHDKNQDYLPKDSTPRYQMGSRVFTTILNGQRTIVGPNDQDLKLEADTRLSFVGSIPYGGVIVDRYGSDAKGIRAREIHSFEESGQRPLNWTMYVNTSREVLGRENPDSESLDDENGICKPIGSEPRLARWSPLMSSLTGGGPGAGVLCGPMPFDADSDQEEKFTLGPYLPGGLATCNGPITYGDVVYVPVRKEWTTFWGKVTQDWQNGGGVSNNLTAFTFVNPCSGPNYTNSAGTVFVYDGTTNNWPEIIIKVALPRAMNPYDYRFNRTARDPAIFEGDIIECGLNPLLFNIPGALPQFTPYVIRGTDYLDDKIGTVKMWIGIVSDIPRGWRVYAALDGKFPLGDNSGTLGSGVFGTTGFDYSFAEVRFIERFE